MAYFLLSHFPHGVDRLRCGSSCWC